MDREFSDIKSDFQIVWDKLDLQAILLFGSYARRENHERSDIDICVVLGDFRRSQEFGNNQIKETLSKIWQQIGGKYDLWIFEELKISIQSQILDEYVILFCNNQSELGEYFYPFYKKVNTYRHRLKVAYGDI